MSRPARARSGDDDRSGPDPKPEDATDSPTVGAGDSSASRAEERAVDRVDYDPSYDPSAPVYCEVCGAAMFYTASCKLVCPRCGYTRDCSDP